jgi:hypothetical protein
VAVTGLSAFSAGIEIFVTARIRPSASRPEQHLPGGPRDLAASRRSFRFGLQFSDGGKAAGGLGSRRPDHDSEPAGPVLYPFAGGGGPHSFISRWWMWPLPPAGPLEFVCEWPAFGMAESRTGIDAQLILDAAASRSIKARPSSCGRPEPGRPRPVQRQAVRTPRIMTWASPGRYPGECRRTR